VTQVRVSAVLFDMDGTLVDSTAMVEQIWAEFAAANGVDALHVTHFAHGRPSRDTVAKFAADPARIDEWNHWIHTAEAQRFTEVTTIPGALDAVRALPSGTWAVVTSAIHAPARDRLAQNGFPPASILIGADDVERGKPHPEGYLAAASALGVEPARCVVFEDTAAGIEAGLAAGCAVVAVGDVDAEGVSGRIRDFTEVSVAHESGEIVLTFP
jgi:sugar-phosphatase